VSEGLAQGPYPVTVSDEDRTRTLYVTFRLLGHRDSGQLWASNLSKVATQWLEEDSNLQPSVTRHITYR